MTWKILKLDSISEVFELQWSCAGSACQHRAYLFFDKIK